MAKKFPPYTGNRRPEHEDMYQIYLKDEQIRIEREEMDQYLKDKQLHALWLKPDVKPVPQSDILSPETFDEYVGQESAKDLAKIMVEAAKNENRSLPNTMVIGEYGLGKTTLAKIIMKASGNPVRMYDGSSINGTFPDNGTFIIDEIHNLDSNVADSLNLYLDRGDYHIIGCTNNPGLLPSAFRSRFRTLQLYPYKVEDLEVIIKKVCARKQVQFNNNAVKLIALRSRFNARQAIMNLSLIFDIMSVNKNPVVNMEATNEAFSKIGVDSRGLLPRDRQYLEALPENRAVGLQYLAAVLGVDNSTIEEEIEPYLLRMGFIDRTPRGRVRIEG